MGWGSFRDRVKRNFSRIANDVDNFQRDNTIFGYIREEWEMDTWFGDTGKEWLDRNGPLTLAFYDLSSMGQGGKDLGWDYIHPPSTVIPWSGGYYNQTQQGFVIEFAYEMNALDLLVDPNNSNNGQGVHNFFVGHLPDCEFDELTMTMTGGNFVSDDDRLPSQFVGANVYQTVNPDADNAEVLTISGFEEAWDPEEPGRVYRQSLRLPWGSPLRVSETYGGPTKSRVPTFVQVYGAGVDAGTPDMADWRIQITVRFIADLLR